MPKKRWCWTWAPTPSHTQIPLHALPSHPSLPPRSKKGQRDAQEALVLDMGTYVFSPTKSLPVILERIPSFSGEVIRATTRPGTGPAGSKQPEESKDLEGARAPEAKKVKGGRGRTGRG